MNNISGKSLRHAKSKIASAVGVILSVEIIITPGLPEVEARDSGSVVWCYHHGF